MTLFKRPDFNVKIAFFLAYCLFFGTKIALHHLKHKNDVSQGGSPAYEHFPVVPMEADHEIVSLRRHLLGIRVVQPHPSSNCTPLAMENFPKDIFRQGQRKQGAVILHILAALYMFIALAILCDEYFIPCLERICEVLRLQPDVAGATFMAAGSSAPELATTLVGVFVAKDDIGLGAVVGSADFNIMLVVSVTALFAKRVIYLNWWPLVRDCVFYLLSIVLLAFVIMDEYIYWYEALILLIVYVIYVGFMHFNPRVDRFWRAWCLEHPTCCPRAIHTAEEEQETKQQHTGAFVQVDTIEDGNGDGVYHAQYERFSDESKDGDAALNEVVDGYPVAFPPSKDVIPNALPPVGSLDAAVLDPDESWFDTCFSPLRLPGSGPGASRGLLHHLQLLCALLVWPLRLIMCLSIPDVRKPRWRRVLIAHWLSFIMCCVWIGLFTIVMMWMITVIGVTFHIPDTIMGLTFIAAGSSVPDAIASVLVVREGEGDMAVSNAVGSNVFDILVCMGLPWFLKCLFSGAPVVIYSKGLLYAVLTLFTTVIFLLAATHLNRWRLTKKYGIILLMGYFVVLLFCSCYELNLFGTVHLPECPLSE